VGEFVDKTGNRITFSEGELPRLLALDTVSGEENQYQCQCIKCDAYYIGHKSSHLCAACRANYIKAKFLDDLLIAAADTRYSSEALGIRVRNFLNSLDII